MESVTNIASLGWRCRVTRRLRDHYGFESRFPFDWWNTPIGGLVRFLKDWDVERLYDRRGLTLMTPLFRQSFIQSREYGFRLMHEFPRDSRDKVLRSWHEHLDEAKAKTRYAMAKFDALNRPHRRVLFVREAAKREDGQAAACVALREAVLAHVPLAQSVFVLVSASGMAADGWIPLKVDDPVEEPWEGDRSVWDPALASLGLRLERTPEDLAAAG